MSFGNSNENEIGLKYMNTVSSVVAEQVSQKKALIITSSGGGGLLQVAKAKEQEIQKAYPGVQIIKKDVLREWLWKWVGRLGIRWWDEAQRLGDVKSLEKTLNLQVYAEPIFFVQIFVLAFKTLLQGDIDIVIDTQPLGTSPIIKAIRLFNRIKKKKIQLEKVLVDLPTEKSTHFFRSIKKLNAKDRKVLQLVTIEPLLEKGETEEGFWLRNCGLSQSEVKYADCYVRQGFEPFRNKPRSNNLLVIPVKCSNSIDRKRMIETYSQGSIQGAEKGEHIHFTIEKNDKVMTILLGSQPSYQATLDYIHKIIELIKLSSMRQNFYLFIFCAAEKNEKKNLCQGIYEKVISSDQYPKNLSIIPMPFQGEEVIAPLFHRTDMSITRSGGATAMELMSVCSGQIWIHSEAKCAPNDFSDEQLLKGIPGWEAGNACYLRDKAGAKIITPEIVSGYLEPLLKDSK